jgi:hypothetical protein
MKGEYYIMTSDLVVCVKVFEGSSGPLTTLNKKYDVVRHWAGYVDIINDNGTLSTCTNENFLTIDDYRELVLKGIGI